MNNSYEKPVRPTAEQLKVDLGRLEWALGLNEEALTAIANTAEWVQFHSGEVVLEVGSKVNHLHFLITGRVKATLHDSLGKEIDNDTIVPGRAIALIAIGSSVPSLLQVEAIEPSTAIRLSPSDLLQLAGKHPDFQLALFRLVVDAAKRYVTVDRSLPKPSVVGIVHHTEASRSLAGRLARRLRELDESPGVVGDDERWKPDGDIPFKLLDRRRPDSTRHS